MTTGPIDRLGIKVGNQIAAPSAFVPTADLAIKTPVKCATPTPTNIILSGLQTIDGIAVGEGDRVLVKDQTDQTTNGIYVVSSGIWSRAPDAAGNDDFVTGANVSVVNGTANAGKIFTLTTTDVPIVIGTSLITWQALNYPRSEIPLCFDGGGAAILPGQKVIMPVPFACTIVGANLFADQLGSIVVDVWKCNYANYPPSAANSICAADLPTLTAAIKESDLSLTGWTINVNKDDIFVGVVQSVSLIRLATLAILVSRS